MCSVARVSSHSSSGRLGHASTPLEASSFIFASAMMILSVIIIIQVSTACGSGRVLNVGHPPATAGGTDLLYPVPSSFILHPCSSDAVAAMLFGIVEGEVCAGDHVIAGLRIGEGRRTDAEGQLK